MAQYGQVFSLAPPVGSAKTWTYKALYRFDGSVGHYPVGRLAADAHGNLYGVTEAAGSYNQGTVFRLMKPMNGAGSWTYQALYEFGAATTDGSDPVTGVTLGSNGRVYGTTLLGPGAPSGAGFGTVFELAPPKNGTGLWSERILHQFSGRGDSAYPGGELAFDSAGRLYGTARGGVGSVGTNYGIVFQIAQASGSADGGTYSVLHRFQPGNDGVYPSGSLLIDNGGNIFGTTFTGGTTNFGTVYELSPPKAAGRPWSESVLYTFSGYNNAPTSGLAMDLAGDLFGTTSGAFQASGYLCGGSAFRLNPPAQGGTAWKEQTLVTFGLRTTKPLGCPDPRTIDGNGLLLATSGALFGTTNLFGRSGGGVIYQLSP